MDIHQIKALVVFLATAIIGYVSVVWYCQLGFSGAIALAIAGLFVAFGLLKVNKWMRPYLNAREYPNNDWYRSHLERNYDILILGDEISREYVPEDLLEGKKVFDCSLQDQNVYADFMVLKNTFSILKPHGLVVLPLREASAMYAEDKFYDERKYYWILSPYVFDSRNWACVLKKVYTRIPVLMFRLRDLKYLIQSVYINDMDSYQTKCKIRRENEWIRKMSNKTRQRDKLALVVRSMDQFCKERDITLEVLNIDVCE